MYANGNRLIRLSKNIKTFSSRYKTVVAKPIFHALNRYGTESDYYLTWKILTLFVVQHYVYHL